MSITYWRTALRLQLQAFKLDQRAVTAIEYALIAALIAVVIISAVTTVGRGSANTFNRVANEL